MDPRLGMADYGFLKTHSEMFETKTENFFVLKISKTIVLQMVVMHLICGPT